MRIMNNVGSLNAWRNLSSTDGALSKSLERLSSGFRINRAADDVAGLAISENMRAQIRGFNQAVRNAQDGISLVQTAEGSLSEVHAMLQRMRELAVQAANGTLQPEDRGQIQTEMDNLTKEVTRITNASKFNNKDLIDGSLRDVAINDITLQIGPNGGQTVTFDISAMDSKSIGISRDILTGFVDNGTTLTGATVSGGTTSVASVDVIGTGISADKSYRIQFDDAGNTLQLEASTDGSTWSAVGGTTVFAASTANVVVGDATTGETLEITTGLDPGVDETNTVAFTGGLAQVVSTVDETGAGLTAGQYTVEYDNSTQKVQLKDITTGDNIGIAVDFAAGEQITLGDANTARTVKVTLLDAMPSATVSDTLTVGSSIGKVLVDEDSVLSATNGVDAVGYGLTAGSYQVQFDQGNGTIQLFNAAGTQAIGDAVAVTAGATDVVIGDSATGRTVTVNMAAGLPLADATAAIQVFNNDQSAEEAKFSGGVKLTDARVYAGLNVSSVSGASDALATIDNAIAMVSTQRAQLGAIQNRLEHTINNLQVVSENLVASESRIRDVDMAMEMSTFTKNQILMQAGTAMLAQANAKNQAVLQLLQ